MDNTITHIEIPAPDLAKAIFFYSAIFNWNIHVMEKGKYAFFVIGETRTGGGLNAELRVAGENQGPQIVIDVEDIEQTLEHINRSGGNTTIPKTEIPGGKGFFAGFTDPNGNHIQLHSRR